MVVFNQDMLRTLVVHATAIPSDATVEQAYRQFEQSPHLFFAVTEDVQFMGLLSRAKLGFVLGSQFGHAVHGRMPVRDYLLSPHLAVTEGTALMDVFSLAMSRDADVFYDDIVLVDEGRRLIGLIPMQTLVRLQSQLIQEQAQLAEEQS